MNTKQYVDHKGHIFNSRQEMCDYWHISVRLYEQRQSKHWTMQERLETPLGCHKGQNPYIDHNGNKFKSLSDMAKYWNIPESTLQARIVYKHMPIEKALTMTETDMHYENRKCKDHTGQEFASISAMCEHWNIPTQVFFGRRKLKWELKDILETPVGSYSKSSIEIEDHLGNKFNSISDMCKYWKIRRSTYNARIKNGWTIEQALTTNCKEIKVEKTKWTDHLGNTYPSLNAMCDTYGITHHTFSTRYKKLGWSLEDSLTKSNIINSKSITDYMGQTFPTIADFCHFYNLPAYMLQGKNYDKTQMKTICRKGVKPQTTIGNITIIKHLKFPYSLVNINNKEYVFSLDEIMDNYHNDNFYPLPDTKLELKDLQIKECIKFPYYIVLYKNKKLVWSYWEIIKYRHDTNFGLSKT